MSLRHKQHGYSLFLVLIIMLVIALIVIVTIQSASTETRLSTNEADRKFALSKAEGGLRAAEINIIQMVETYAGNSGALVTFDSACTNGFCSPTDGTFTSNPAASKPFQIASPSTSNIPAWERCAAGLSGNCDTINNVLEKGGINFGNQARYIIEYLGIRTMPDNSTRDYFRITSRAHGNNEDTVVTLQTHVELKRN